MSPAQTRLPPSIEHLRPLLATADVDRVAAMVVSLLVEVVDLSERLARLEGNAAAETQTERIAALVERVLSRS